MVYDISKETLSYSFHLVYNIFMCYFNYYGYPFVFFITFTEHVLDIIYVHYVTKDVIQVLYDLLVLFFLLDFTGYGHTIHTALLFMRIPHTVLYASALIPRLPFLNHTPTPTLTHTLLHIYTRIYYLIHLYLLPTYLFTLTPLHTPISIPVTIITLYHFILSFFLSPYTL